MDFSYWKQDFKASVVVFLVALPLCLGIALASGAPLSSGLIAGMIGGIVVGSISNSHVSVSGPAAGLTVIVISAITDLGNFHIFTLSVFLAGLIQIIFSFIHGGRIGDFFPASVIKGMLAAIGLILILKQIPHMIGYDEVFMGSESFSRKDGNTFTDLLIAFDRFHVGAFFVGLVSLLIMLGWNIAAKKNKFFQIVPGALIAVISGILINLIYMNFIPALAIQDKQLVQLPEFISGFGMPQWSHIMNPKVLGTALIIALVASIESLLSVEAADKLDETGRITDKNRELLAQGMGNTLSGLIGGLPVTAVIVRTSANVTAGAMTKLSAILHGLWLLLCVATIPHILNLIPLSSLAAMLILVGYKLAKPSLFMEMHRKGMNQFLPFVVTILAILFTDLLIGIIIGMTVGFFFVLRSNQHKSIVMVKDGDNYLIKFYKDVTFLQKSMLLSTLKQIPENASVVIDGSKNIYVDDDIAEVIDDFVKRSQMNGIKVELKKSTLALSPIFRG